MDEQKKEETTMAAGTPEVETTPVADAVAPEVAAVVEEAAPVVAEVAEVAATEATTPAAMPTAFNYKMYIGAVLAILAISAGLIFALEKEGRISTGLFSTVIEKMEASEPVATVNGVDITRGEYNISLGQLTQMAGSQGANVTDATVIKTLSDQTIETLVNGELLLQAAVASGKTVSAEQVDARYNEIVTGLGGEEAMAAKMAEFGVTKESLLEDIRSEILIQGLFEEKKIGPAHITVSEEEVKALYDQAGGAAAGLPAIAEVREVIESQIKGDKEQVQIGDLIQELRVAAEIELHI